MSRETSSGKNQDGHNRGNPFDRIDEDRQLDRHRLFRASVRSGAAKATALPAVRTKVKNSAAGCSNFMIGRLLSIIQTFVCKFLLL